MGHAVKTYPLTHPQKGVWNVEKIHKGTAINNVAGTLRVEGNIDFKLLEKAINLVIEKNDALRLRFIEINGEPRQYISEYEYTKIDYFDFSKKDIKELYQWDVHQTRLPLSLEEGPLFYFAMLKIRDDEAGIYAKYHHLISDAWTVVFTGNRILEYYFSLKSGCEIDEKEYSYIEYINIEQEYKNSERFIKDREYWHGMFPDLPEKTVLKPKKTDLGNTIAERKSFVLPDKLCKKIKEHCMETKSTIFGIFLASLAMYINRVTNKNDIVIGIPVLNRRNAAEKNTAGMFVSAVPFRITIENDLSYKEFSEKISRNWLSVLRHQRYPYDVFLEELRGKHNYTENLYDIVLSYQNAKLISWDSRIEFQRLGRWHFNGNQIESLSIHINDREDNGNIILNFDYLKDVFCEKEIEFIYDHLIRLLWHALDNPDREVFRIHMVSERERHKILHEFNDTKRDYPKDKTISQLFQDQAGMAPDKPAVIFEEETMTYAELNRKSNQLARLLREKGVRQGSIVGLMLERSFNMIIGILAILKAGGAYLPIDSEYPVERVNFMLKDSKAEILLTQEKLADKPSFDGSIVKIEDVELHRYEDTDPENVNKPDDLAYVIYTSGSTGTPKGVMIEHKGIVNLRQVFRNRLGIGPEDKVVQFSSISFDASVWEIFMALLLGATLAIPTKNAIENFESFENYLNNNQVTVATLPPSYLAHLNPANVATLKTLISAGSALPLELYKKWRNNVLFVNAYGPTENTICSTMWIDGESGISDNSVPIGKPLYNMQAYILNENKMIQPIGIPGELYMSGIGLARGYLNRDDLTNQNFIDNPFLEGEKMYKTGDLARWYPNGDIRFLGRIDNQVKIRGYRVELGEIENVLASHPSIKEVAVTTETDENGNNTLCAYYIPDGHLEKHVITSFLLKRLPLYMVPSHFVKLDKFPLTSSGKIDTKLLPKPEIGVKTKYAAPANQIEVKLAEIWSEILNTDADKLSTNCTLLDLGADSLDIIKFITQVHKHFNVQLSMKDLFELQTIQATGEYILKHGIDEYLQIKKLPEGQEYYPVSSAQKRLYLLSSLKSSGLSYNMPGVMLIEGKVDRQRFENAIKEIINRHESLRTSFKIIDSQPVQFIHESVDFELYYREAGEQEIQSIIKYFFAPFQLDKAPLLKVGLIRLDDKKHLLLFDMHHIISDGESIRILLNELAGLYAGETPPSLNIQYKDYTAWLSDLLYTDKMKKMEDFWTGQFPDDIPVLNMPTDFPRPPVQSFEGGKISFRLNKSLAGKIKKISRENNATLYMTLLAAYNVLLSKYTDQEDIVVGTPVEGRPHADLRGMIGMFVNTLPLRNYPEGKKTFKQFLSEVRDNSLKAFENMDYPFDEMVRKLVATRDPSRNPLFDTMLVMQKYDFTEINMGDMKLKPYKYDFNISKFDITLEAFEQSEGTAFNFEYCTKLYRESTIERMAEHYVNVLTTIAENTDIDLSEINMLSEKEKKQLLYDFNKTRADYPADKTIHQLFEEQVERTPDKTALVFEGREMTYDELNKRANQLAAVLRRKGVKPDTIVGLMLERSFEMIIGILGILKAGGAYLPIDPDYPAERIEYMLKDSNVRILLTEEAHLDRLIYDGELINLRDNSLYEEDNTKIKNINNPNDLVYVIYTSGSTGLPKGVMIEHRGVVNYITWADKVYVRGDKITFPLYSSLAFDLTVTSIFTPLITGNKIIIYGENKDERELLIRKVFRDEEVDIVKLTPSHLKLVQDMDCNSLNIKRLILGGEDLKTDLARKIFDNFNGKVEIFNEYGPTETVVGCMIYKYDPVKDRGISVPIGVPADNVRLYIMDKHHKLVPIGVAGELCIAGDGVARGYLNRPELTSRCFIDNPYKQGERIYKTGDIARWNNDGMMEYLGRRDKQVKIRGYRIELGEIEKKLVSYDGIKEALVINRNNGDGKNVLCAYVITNNNIDVVNIKEYLAKSLPQYMIPSYIHSIDKIPLTDNGKVDLKALPELKEVIDSQSEYLPPRDDIEKTLAKIWCEVLNVEKVGIKTSFFDLGGDSLNVLQMLFKLEKFNWKLTSSDIFALKTIEQLSMKIKGVISDTLNEINVSDIAVVDAKTEPHLIKVSPKKLNNVLLTGATGFLGSHILNDLLSRPNTRVYCLVRSKNEESEKERLLIKLGYYFKKDYKDLIDNRIYIYDGDITLEKFGLPENEYRFLSSITDTVIHTAAIVKHFGEYKDFEEVNVNGTKRVINFSLENKSGLAYISTLSIFGNYLVDRNKKSDKRYSEEDFYVGQNYNESVYVRSKFEAENEVIKAMKHGLNATIFRIGNLTGRHSDGHFQENINESFFYNSLISVLIHKILPKEFLGIEIEMTPVDYASKAVTMITGTEESTGGIYHIFNPNKIKIRELLYIIQKLGLAAIRLLDYKSFMQCVNEIAKHDNRDGSLYGFMDSMRLNKDIVYNDSIDIDAGITCRYLSKLGFEWPVIDEEYIKKMTNHIKDVSFVY